MTEQRIEDRIEPAFGVLTVALFCTLPIQLAVMTHWHWHPLLQSLISATMVAGALLGYAGYRHRVQALGGRISVIVLMTIGIALLAKVLF